MAGVQAASLWRGGRRRGMEGTMGIKAVDVLADGEEALRGVLAVVMDGRKDGLGVEWWHERETPDGKSQFILSRHLPPFMDDVAGGKLPFRLNEPAHLSAFLHARLETADRGERGGGDGSYVRGWRLRCDGWGPIEVTAEWTYYGK